MNAMKVYQALEENGFKKESAEKIVLALQESQDLATKLDLFMTKEELSERITDVAGNVKDLRGDMYKLLLAQFVAIMGGVAFLLKVLH